jgi:ATP-dependent phosphofructokinase / diphosphate-dependent phosphofructokinase
MKLQQSRSVKRIARPNALAAQSVGLITEMNASACGVMQEAMKSGKIGTIFDGINGTLGVLNEVLFAMSAEKPETIEPRKLPKYL